MFDGCVERRASLDIGNTPTHSAIEGEEVPDNDVSPLGAGEALVLALLRKGKHRKLAMVRWGVLVQTKRRTDL